MTNDKESYVCLNCYFVGPLNEHGRCTKCDSDVVASVNLLQQTAQAEGKIPPRFPSKPLRWWHFVCGPFETFISNYRVKDVDEAKRHVCLDGYEWSVRCDRNFIVFAPRELSPDDNYVEDISNDEFDALLTAKHRRGVGTPSHLVDEQEKAQENNTAQTVENKTT